MGRLIDADKLIEYWLTPPMNIGWDDEIEDVNNQPTVEAIPKEEVVTMLEEIESMFWELTKNKYDMQILYEKADNFEADFNSFIQQKINSLKEKKND